MKNRIFFYNLSKIVAVFKNADYQIVVNSYNKASRLNRQDAYFKQISRWS